MRFLKKFFIVFCLFMPLSCLAQIVELDVYQEWRTDKSQLKNRRSFFMIRDYPAFERFWKEANMDGEIPYFDFAKYMVLVWSPGKTLFDCRDVKLQRFVSKDSALIAVYNFVDRKQDSVWHSPCVATLLPVGKSDFFIQSVKKDGVQVKYKTVYTLWNMDGERTIPFKTVGLDNIVKPEIKLVSHYEPEPETQPASKPSVQRDVPIEQTLTQKPAASAPKAAQPVQPAVQAAAPAQPAPISQTLSKPVPVENPFAPKKEEVKKGDNSPIGNPSLPVFEEDPLFGSEFDIEF